jgi:transposase InsO family protein
VADLTYVRLPEGEVFLACLLEVSSRTCICWSLSRRIDAQLPLQALEMALAQRVVSAGLIHHSDRGKQSCSNRYVQRLLDVGADISMSTPGQPTENACVESFIKTLFVRRSVSASVPDL